MTSAHRQAKLRKARKDAGLVRLEMWVPAGKLDQIKECVGAIVAPNAGSTTNCYTLTVALRPRRGPLAGAGQSSGR